MSPIDSPPPLRPDDWSRDLDELIVGLLATRDTESTLRAVASFTARHLGVDRCSIILTRADLGIGHVVVSLEDQSIRNLQIRLDAYPEVLAALEGGVPVLVRPEDGTALSKHLAPLFSERGIGSVVVAPLAVREVAIGVLFFRTPEFRPALTRADLARLRPIVQITAVALDDAIRNGHLKGLAPAAERLASLARLISGLRHFLNNPLSAALGFTELLLADRSLPAQARADVEQIRTAAERTREVVANVAQFAQDQSIGRAIVPIAEILRDAVANAAPAAKRSGIELESLSPSPSPTVWGSVQLLTDALGRMLQNACEAVDTVSGPRSVSVRGEAVGPLARLLVRDNGPGVPAEFRGEIFEPFFSTHRATEHMGLGLAIAHGIVEAHGGRLYLDVGDETRTTFVMELPIATQGISFGSSGS